MSYNLKRGGIRKLYARTRFTFTKLAMWPERYRNELNGLLAAERNNISAPRLLRSSLTRAGGSITTELIYKPRADQLLWQKPQLNILYKIGMVLRRIHRIPTERGLSSIPLQRRFADLQTDILRRSSFRPDIVMAAEKTMKAVEAIMSRRTREFTHGDFTLQNIFIDGEDILVFDWEHSGCGSGLYDIGSFCSFLLLPVTDGGWNFTDYNTAMAVFLRGYGAGTRPNQRDLLIIAALRFLGHRQVAQYYLFALEYLAVIEKNRVAWGIFGHDVSEGLEKVRRELSEAGLKMDDVYFAKIVGAIQRGGYSVSWNFWNWFKREIVTQKGP